MRTASVSARKTTVSGGRPADLPAAVRRRGERRSREGRGASSAVPGAAVRTTSKPLDGSPFTVRYFSSRSWACLSVPPALDSTKRTAGVSSSTSCSGWFTTGAAAAVPAVVGAAAAGGGAAGVGGRRRRSGRRGRRHRRLGRRKDLLPENEDAGADDDREDDPFFHFLISGRLTGHPGRLPGPSREGLDSTSLARPRGYRVYTTSAEGVTARETPNHQPAAARGAVVPDRLFRVDRARGLESAGRTEQRRQRSSGRPGSRRAAEPSIKPSSCVQPLRKASKLGGDRLKTGASRLRSRDHDDVEALRQRRSPTAARLANPALDPIARHGVAHLAAHGDAEARRGLEPSAGSSAEDDDVAKTSRCGVE